MKLLILITTFFFFNQSFSQDKELITFDPQKKYTQIEIDSIIKNFNPTKANLSELKKMLEFNKNLKGWQYYFFAKANNSLRNNFLDSVIFYTDKSITVFIDERKLDKKYLIDSYVLKAYALSKYKQYSNSIIYYQKALDLTKSHPYKNNPNIMVGLAENHYKMGNDSLAINHLLIVSKDSVYMNNPKSAIPIYGKIASLYYDLGKIKKAKQYCKKGIQKSYTTNNVTNLSAFYGFLGVLNYDEKKQDSALYYIKKALTINKKFGVATYIGAKETNKFYEGYINVFEGSLEVGIENLNDLIKTLSEVKKITKDDKALMVRALQVLGVAYEKQNNPREYLIIIKKATTFLDKFYEIRLKENLDKLEIQYQTKEKDLSIAQLEKSKEQRDTIINQQRIISLSLGGGLLLFIGLGTLFWRQRKLKTQYEKENLEQRLLRLQMNPHFIGNAMNTINAMVEKKSKDTFSYVNNLSTLFRLILVNSREEFVSLEDEIAIIKSYLKLQSNFSKEFDYTISIDGKIDQESTIIPPMLIQPIVENAIVHGLANGGARGLIAIEIFKQEEVKGLLICKITDNGVGYSENASVKTSSKKTSISGDIIKERLKILKNKFNLDLKITTTKTHDGKGTLAELYLPYLID